MKRKINLVGKNTLTVSLPASWVAQLALHKGDELTCTTTANAATFHRGAAQQPERAISVDITDFNKYLLSKWLTTLYRTQFNTITLIHRADTIADPKTGKSLSLKTTITNLCERFIGMDVITQTATKTELQCFLLSDDQNLQAIEKRIYFLLKETVEQFLEGALEHHSDFHARVYDHHDGIVKYVNYYLRKLAFVDVPESEKKALHTLYTMIDMMVDKLRHTSERIEKHGCTPKAREYLRDIFTLLFEHLEQFHHGELPKSLIEKRYKLAAKLENDTFTAKEWAVLAEAKTILDTTNVFANATILKRIESQL